MPVVALLAVPGCFDSYSLGSPGVDAGGPGDYPCDCCGVTVLASGPDECLRGVCDPYCFVAVDAGPGIREGGLGASDVPLDPSCGPRALDVVCFDHVPAGRPTTVSFTLGLDASECFCGQELVCSTRVDAAARTIALDTSLCPLTPICRACEGPPVGSCELPALDAGAWHVTVNGEDALDLDVTPPDVFPERADVCVRRAIVDGCGAIWSPMSFAAGRACHQTAVPEGTRTAIRVYDACGGCVQRGPCTVTVVDGTIRVSPTRLPYACDIACPSICVADEHVCLTPPLGAGTYRIAIDGLPTSEPTTIEVGPAGMGLETCIGG